VAYKQNQLNFIYGLAFSLGYNPKAMPVA